MPKKSSLMDFIDKTTETTESEEFEEKELEPFELDIDKLMNEIAYEDRPIDDKLYDIVVLASLSYANRLGRYKRLFRSEIAQQFTTMNLALDLDMLENNPAQFRAEYLSDRDLVKNAFIMTVSTFAQAKLFYERTILVMAKLIRYQQHKLNQLEEMLKKEKELL